MNRKPIKTITPTQATGHTPGPWQYHLGRGANPRLHIQTSAGYQVASTPEVNKYETREADARLIAAAPSLLDALALITKCARTKGPHGTVAYFISDEAMTYALAAIDKATGEPLDDGDAFDERV